jgi:Allene oxide cyclase barrel like domain
MPRFLLLLLLATPGLAACGASDDAPAPSIPTAFGDVPVIKGAEGESAGRAPGRLHVVHVKRETGDDIFLDLDHSATPGTPAPDSVGDADAYTADFFARGRKVGLDGGTCVLVRLPAWFHCVATNNLPKGDLTVQFLHDYSETGSGRFAITGGTRAYRGASGVVIFVDHPAPRRDDVTFRFSTP